MSKEKAKEIKDFQLSMQSGRTMGAMLRGGKKSSGGGGKAKRQTIKNQPQPRGRNRFPKGYKYKFQDGSVCPGC